MSAERTGKIKGKETIESSNSQGDEEFRVPPLSLPSRRRSTPGSDPQAPGQGDERLDIALLSVSSRRQKFVLDPIPPGDEALQVAPLYLRRRSSTPNAKPLRQGDVQIKPLAITEPPGSSKSAAPVRTSPTEEVPQIPEEAEADILSLLSENTALEPSTPPSAKLEFSEESHPELIDCQPKAAPAITVTPPSGPSQDPGTHNPPPTFASRLLPEDLFEEIDRLRIPYTTGKASDLWYRSIAGFPVIGKAPPEVAQSTWGKMSEKEREAMKPAPLNIAKDAGGGEAGPTPPNTSVELSSSLPFVQMKDLDSIISISGREESEESPIAADLTPSHGISGVMASSSSQPASGSPPNSPSETRYDPPQSPATTISTLGTETVTPPSQTLRPQGINTAHAGGADSAASPRTATTAPGSAGSTSSRDVEKAQRDIQRLRVTKDPTIGQLCDEVYAATRARDSAIADLNAAKQACDTEKATLRAEIRDLSKKMKEEQNKNKTLRNEKQRAERDYVAQIEGAQRSHSRELEKKDREKKQFEDQLAAMDKRLKDSEKDNTELQATVNAKVDTESIGKELEKKDAKIKSLERELELLRTDYDTRAIVIADLVQKDEDQEEELQNIQHLKRRIEEMQEQINTLNEARGFDQAARETLAQEKNDVARQLKDATDQMNNDAGNLAELRNRNHGMSDRIKELEKKISEHEATLAEQVVAERTLRQNVATSRERICELTRDKELLTVEKEKHQKQPENCESEKTRLADQITTFTTQTTGRSDEIARLTKEIEDLRSQESTTNQAFANVQKDLQKLKRELDDLTAYKEQEKQDCEAEKERLGAEIGALKAQIGELNIELNTANAEYNEIFVHAEELESRHARQMAELDECKQRNQSWQDKDTEWAKAVAERDEDIDEYIRQLKDAVAKIRSTQQEVKTVKEQSIELMDRMQILRTNNGLLENMNVSLQRRVDELHKAKESEINKPLEDKQRDLEECQEEGERLGEELKKCEKAHKLKEDKDALNGQIRTLRRLLSESSRKGLGDAQGEPPEERDDGTECSRQQRGSGSDLHARGHFCALSEDEEKPESPSTTTRGQETPATRIIRESVPQPDAPPRRFRRESPPSDLGTSLPLLGTSPETVAFHRTENPQDFISPTPYEGPQPFGESIELAILRCEAGFQKMRDERAQKGFHQGDSKIALAAAKDIWGAAQILPEGTDENNAKRDYFIARGAFMQGVAYYYADEALRARPFFVEAGTRDPYQYPAELIDAWVERIADTQGPPKEAAYYKDPVPAWIRRREEKKEKKEKKLKNSKTSKTPTPRALDKPPAKRRVMMATITMMTLRLMEAEWVAA